MAVPTSQTNERPLAEATVELTVDVLACGVSERLHRIKFGIGDGSVIGGTP